VDGAVEVGRFFEALTCYFPKHRFFRRGQLGWGVGHGGLLGRFASKQPDKGQKEQYVFHIFSFKNDQR